MKRMMLLVLVVAGAEISAGQGKLTLDGAVGIAMERNYALRATSHGMESAQWEKRNAITNFLPKVELTSEFTRIDPETDRRANASVDFIKSVGPSLGIPPSALADIRPFVYRDAYTTTLQVVQPIYNGGAEILGVRAADAIQDQARYTYEDTEQDVMARVKTSYFTVLKAAELLTLAKESAERTQRWLEMTRRREELGSRTKTDVLRFEVQLAADQGNIVNAENYLAAARLQLNEVMGVDLDKSYTLEPVPMPDSLIVSSSTKPVFQFASLNTSVPSPTLDQSFLATHPSMKMMETNLRLADISVDRNWVNFKPRVNLAFQYGWEQNNTLKLDGIRPWALSLVVRWPIFNGFGDYTNLQKSQAEYQRAEENVESFKRGLLMQARNAELNVKATQQRIEIARIGLQQATEVLASVTRRYDAGSASNVDLIDAQTAYSSAKTSYITAVYDNYISNVQLARATGRVSR